jgi:hypothetical protein
MNRVRVKIGSLVLHQSGLNSAEGAALGHMVEAHLQQLMLGQGAPSEPRSADVVQVNAPLPDGKGASRNQTARAIAHAVYGGLQGKG